MPNNLQKGVQSIFHFLTAALTPIIAIFGVWIAFSQWYLAKNRLRLDLFDRRMAVISAYRELIVKVLRDFKIEERELWQFGYDMVGIRWLFDQSVENFLSSVTNKLWEARASQITAESSPGTEQSFVARAKVSEIMVWLASQASEFDKRFGPFMQLDEPLNAFAVRTLQSCSACMAFRHLVVSLFLNARGIIKRS